ncbi:uncharacterized protein LOC133196841 [Saccostrea echinata]|uniref:uncharacterized protein LOC133196841 n=1 Tax=Saccostrea echinata TaxID=191078 RepID=UPI002A828D14|nr:uncharacterized protein LOC133196841 [Saccostrea echinata]
MEHLKRFSDAVYEGMCFIAGTPNEVAIRRDVEDVHDVVLKPLQERRQIRTIKSGSYKEGFRFRGSDIDQMFWMTNHRLIWNLEEAGDFNSSSDTFILLNWNPDRLGFVFLELLSPTFDSYVGQSIFNINDKLFISSLLYRESTLQWIRPNTTVHGPCANEKDGNVEWDRVHCFICKHWPPFALPFIERSLKNGWPREDHLCEALATGCQVVPIGLKGSPLENYEWRLSFCTAEQKLVHSLNHTQFMCFGLLKLFIKEVVNAVDEQDEPLLCSFFVKTVLFWVIQNDKVIQWVPSDLLRGFWCCLKYLLHCVFRGYLPNFFLPENNLFTTKVRGQSQQKLFENLYELYKMGFPCLFQSKTLRPYLCRAISNLSYIPRTDEAAFVSEIEEDKHLFYEMGTHDAFNTYCSDINESVVLLSGICNLNPSSLTHNQFVALEKFTSSILRYLAYHLHNMKFFSNKNRYRVERLCEQLLTVVAKMGWLSDVIYIPLYLYVIGKIGKAVKHIEWAKLKFCKPFVMYRSEVDRESYVEELWEMSLSYKRRYAALRDIRIERVVIKELELEEKTTKRYCLYAHPKVMLNMLYLLCNRGNENKQHEALHEMYDFLTNDDSHIPPELEEMSWEMLGICQQLCGDFRGAVQSFQMSLDSELLFHGFENATMARIKKIQKELSE